MKSEPGYFSLQDLKDSPEGVTAWEGVRNYQARNLLRDEIAVGDGVLFYHSNIPEPAIVGIARVIRSGYPDHTARNPESRHFDPRATEENPIWYMVDVQYVAELSCPLTRERLRRHPLLESIAVLKKGNRLSVQPVSEKEWRAVLECGALPDPLSGG